MSQNLDLALATRLMHEAEITYATADIPAILQSFTDDIVINYADIPSITGKVAAEAFIRARFQHQKNYHPHKSIQAVAGNLICIAWHGDWINIQTGRLMYGRGSELWTIRGGKMCKWEATFNMWYADTVAHQSLPLLAL